METRATRTQTAAVAVVCDSGAGASAFLGFLLNSEVTVTSLKGTEASLPRWSDMSTKLTEPTEQEQLTSGSAKCRADHPKWC